jgi:dienelactone hydrolase
MVDPQRIAAMGYCFGGLCVLDLARSATPHVKGVVSIHGLFAKPELGEQPPISAKVLVLHGWDDPMAPPAHVLALAQELTAARADWQLHAHGHAMHAFTHAQAAAPERGLQYHADAARRSWLATRNFLEEVFA